MQIFKTDKSRLASAYNILCQSVLPATLQGHTPPMGISFCVVPTLGHTTPHDHYDGEIFVIVKGRGIVKQKASQTGTVDFENSAIGPGDVIYFNTHNSHQILNESRTEEIEFYSIYWDTPAFEKRKKNANLIFSAPPTPNGKLHVGHLSGPYFAADVFSKFCKLKGEATTYCSGADENQSYVPTKARQLKAESALKVAQDYTKSIKEILEKFNASPDNFLIPHKDEKYQKFVQDFFFALVTNKTLVAKESNYPFCKSCDFFVHESNVSGMCPHCNSKTNGNGCEPCGLYNDCRDLKDPHCNICGTKCEMEKSTRYVFDLKKYKDYLASSVAKKKFPIQFHKYINRLLESGLGEVTVTYPYSWGIPAPNSKDIIFEWLEMAAAYLYQGDYADSASLEKRNVNSVWIDTQSKVTLCHGFDNSFYYLAMVPALHHAFDQNIKYPDQFLINYFYLLENKKFSTSRNHAVWGDDILSKIPNEWLRLYLAKTRPEQIETNFTIAELNKFILDQHFCGLDFLIKELQGTFPASLDFGNASEFTLQEIDIVTLETFNTFILEAELAYQGSHFSLNTIYEIQAKLVTKLLNEIQTIKFKFPIYAQKNLQNAPPADQYFVSAARTVLGGMRALAQILNPICPIWSSALFKSLGVNPGWSRYIDLPTNLNPQMLPMDYFKIDEPIAIST